MFYRRKKKLIDKIYVKKKIIIEKKTKKIEIDRNYISFRQYFSLSSFSLSLSLSYLLTHSLTHYLSFFLSFFLLILVSEAARFSEMSHWTRIWYRVLKCHEDETDFGEITVYFCLFSVYFLFFFFLMGGVLMCVFVCLFVCLCLWFLFNYSCVFFFYLCIFCCCYCFCFG